MFQEIHHDGTELANLVSNVHECEDQVFSMIASLKSRYKTKSALNKLRKAFLQQLEPTLPADPEAKRLAQRRVADHWRCIRYAMENEVPRHCFVSTNWKRIRDKMEHDTDSSSDESVSSSFEGLIPLFELSPVSDTLPLVSMAADGEGAAASVSSVQPEPPTRTKKKGKKRKKGSSRGSKSKLVLFNLFVSFVTFAVEISRPAEDQLYPRVKEAEVQKVDFTFLKPLNFIFFIPKNRSL